jgi:hypothetical protein
MTTPELRVNELFGSRLAKLIPDAIPAALAAEFRAQLDAIGYERYRMLDRGSYEIASSPPPELLAGLVEIARRATGQRQQVVEARALRLSAGDYLLAHHDRVHDGHPIELVLELSARPNPGAEVHYRRRGQVFFRVPSAPCSLALIERGPTVTCNHTYVSKRDPGACVVRVVALLR